MVSITHKKTGSIPNWTQADIDKQIASGNLPPGTTPANIILTYDWNDTHNVTGVVESIVAGTNISVDNTDPANPIISSTGDSSIGGSIATNQVAFGSGTDTITGTDSFTYNGTLTVDTDNSYGSFLAADSANTGNIGGFGIEGTNTIIAGSSIGDLSIWSQGNLNLSANVSDGVPQIYLTASGITALGFGNFRIDPGGNITTLFGQPTSFPGTNSVGALTNDGSGNFSYVPATSGSSAGIDGDVQYSDGAGGFLATPSQGFWTDSTTLFLGIYSGTGPFGTDTALSLGADDGFKQLIYDGNLSYAAGFSINRGTATNEMSFFIGNQNAFSVSTANAFEDFPFPSGLTSQLIVNGSTGHTLIGYANQSSDDGVNYLQVNGGIASTSVNVTDNYYINGVPLAGGTVGGSSGNILWNNSGVEDGFGAYSPTGSDSGGGLLDLFGNSSVILDNTGSLTVGVINFSMLYGALQPSNINMMTVPSGNPYIYIPQNDNYGDYSAGIVIYDDYHIDIPTGVYGNLSIGGALTVNVNNNGLAPSFGVNNQSGGLALQVNNSDSAGNYVQTFNNVLDGGAGDAFFAGQIDTSMGVYANTSNASSTSFTAYDSMGRAALLVDASDALGYGDFVRTLNSVLDDGAGRQSIGMLSPQYAVDVYDLSGSGYDIGNSTTGDWHIDNSGNATFAGTVTGASFNGYLATGNVSQFTNDAGYLTSLSGAVTSVSGTTNRITSSGGFTPAIDISSSYLGQTSITTLGTITTGVWHGTAIANANLANSTISGVALGSNLAALSATNGTLTFSGSYTGATARTVGLNLANGNTWTATQQFNTPSTSTAAQILKWGASGQTGDVWQLQDNSANVLARVFTTSTQSGFGVTGSAHVGAGFEAALVSQQDELFGSSNALYLLPPNAGGSGRIFMGSSANPCYSVDFTHTSNLNNFPGFVVQKNQTADGTYILTPNTGTVFGNNAGGDQIILTGTLSYMTNPQGGTLAPGLAWKSYSQDTDPYQYFYSSAYCLDTKYTASSLTTTAHTRWKVSGTDIMSLSATAALKLGIAGTTSGSLALTGSTSGVVTVNTAVAAGTWTMTLPTGAGSANQVLQTNGSGVTSWVAQNSYAPTTADLTAQSAAVSSVVAVTSPNDGSAHQYRVGGYVAVTAVVTDVAQFQCTFTDQNSNSVTINFFPQGLTSANIATTGFFALPPQDIRVKANTTITLKTILTTSIGSITYDVGGNIQRIN